MANFLDKLKQGATKVSDMAQQTVEITRLSTQISSKKKEIDHKLMTLGLAVFNGYCNDSIDQEASLISRNSQEILAIQHEISTLEQRIKQLKNEKDCVCGRVVSFDTKFCPSCGNKFEAHITPVDVIPVDAEVVVSMPECSNCHAALEHDAKYCESCGCKVTPV